MSLPREIDPLQREWVEAQIVEQYRRQLSAGMVAFVAFGPGREAHLAGTGFVVGSNGRDAIVMTAKHVLTEGVLRFQKPWQQHVSSALPEFLQAKRGRISVDPSKLRAIWFGEETGDMCIVHHAHYADSLDIAVCLISLQDNTIEHAKILPFALDTGIPEVGAPINLLSTSQMAVEVDEIEPVTAHQSLTVRKNVSARLGTVTGVFPNGYRQFHWPCFATSIPAEPGMSGGLAYRPVDGRAIGACGVVSADCSEDGARGQFHRAGNSIISMIWPAVGYGIPAGLPASPDTEQRTLLDLIRAGEIKDLADGAQKLFITRHGADDYSVGRHP